MDQVSRPLLIALACTAILGVLWMTALRPKPADIAATPAAPVEAVGQAANAAAISDSSNAALQAASGGAPAPPPAGSGAANPATAPAKKADPAPAAAERKTATRRDGAALRDVRSGKVVVVLFWSYKGSDDRASRNAVRSLNRHGGKVAVHIVPISRVSSYDALTRGLTINQAPTTLVIDRKRRARMIVGLTERGELTQLVDDALKTRR